MAPLMEAMMPPMMTMMMILQMMQLRTMMKILTMMTTIYTPDPPLFKIPPMPPYKMTSTQE